MRGLRLCVAMAEVVTTRSEGRREVAAAMRGCGVFAGSGRQWRKVSRLGDGDAALVGERGGTAEMCAPWMGYAIAHSGA